MRLGGPVFVDSSDPDQWAAAVRAKGYRAAYCPARAGVPVERIAEYARAARDAGLIIAEVGVWNNPLTADEHERRKALDFCKKQLALADEIGARCCVNVAGSRGSMWYGPHPNNLTDETFDCIVEVVREILDAVRPRQTYYTLETLPWMFPDSPESYLALLRAVDRDRFAVHLDPGNLICSPRRYFDNAAYLTKCFEMLGPWIKSVHAKDVLLGEQLPTHLYEVQPGLGFLDYHTLLRLMQGLPADTPLMLEHLEREDEYDQAAAYIHKVAAEVGIRLE